MNARTIQPLTAAGLAAALTAATITTAGLQSAEVSPSLRIEFAAVQLQAVTIPNLPAAAVTADPVQILTGVVQNVVGIAAAALWYAAFPITLPLSVLGGLVASVIRTVNQPQASTTVDPFQGLSFFFTAPNVLLTTGIANIGLAMNVNQHQMLHFPIGMAAAVRPAAAVTRTSTAPAAAPTPATSARSVKKVAAAAQSGAKATKRAATTRSAR